MTQNAGDYAFPHANTAESRRLDLFAGRLDPVTKRRIGQLGLVSRSCVPLPPRESHFISDSCRMVT